MKKGLIAAAGAVVGVVAGATAVSKVQASVVESTQDKVDKFKQYYNMLVQWLILKQAGKSLEQYFIDHNYKTIAIYGMGEMGSRLYDELKETSIVVNYGIDQEALGEYSELEVFSKEEDYPDVDAIIVTATFAFDVIEEELRSKVHCPIISLENVVYDI